MKLLAATILLIAASICQAQDCSTMNIQHVADIPSVTTEMTMTMQQDNTGKPYLYVASKEGGLKIYDITSLSTPVLARTIPATQLENLDVMNLSQSGAYLYLALGNHFTNPERSGMAIVDVSMPANATVTDTWRMDADSGGGGIVKVEGNYAYLGAMSHGVIIFDISNKSDITFVSQFVPDINYPTPNPNPDLYNARGMEVKDGIVYLCYDAGGIRIINTTDKQNPRETGRFSNPLLNGKPRAYNNLVLDDTLLYVAVDFCGLEVLSIADTSNIKLVGWWNPMGCVTGNWFAASVHANEIEYNKSCKNIFVSTGKSDMYVLDVSNPAAPDSCNMYGGVDNQVGTWGVSIEDNRIYLSYIFALIPFQSNWTGVKILTYTPCTSGVENRSPQLLQIYPQPASDRINIHVSESASTPFVTVTNMLGHKHIVPFISSSEEIVVDIAALSPGIYTLHWVNGKTIHSQKFVKH